jgi:hypothetical protein
MPHARVWPAAIRGPEAMRETQRGSSLERMTLLYPRGGEMSHNW